MQGNLSHYCLIRKRIKQVRRNQYYRLWNFRFSKSGLAVLRSWTIRRRESSSIGGTSWSPSSQWIPSSWPTTRQCLQSFQRKFEEDDARIGQHRVLRIVRNGFQGTILLLSVLFGTRIFLYCTCALCFNNTEEVRKLNQGRFGALSISNWIIRKKSVHGARHGMSQEQTYYHQSFNARNRCRKKTDESQKIYRQSWPIPQRRKIPWVSTKVGLNRS